jgi:hypothetical protein
MMHSATGMRAGFVFPIVILGILSVIFLAVFVSNLGSGYANQVAHVDEVTRCCAIADSAFSIILARIRNQPFSQRFFAEKPFSSKNNPLFGGTYSVYVVDTPPPRINQVDVYIQSTYRRVTRLFFWRFEDSTSILNSSGRLIPIVFSNLSPRSLPNTPTGSPFLDLIDQILTERAAKAGPAQEKAKILSTITDVKDAIRFLDVPVVGPPPETTTLPPPPPPLPPASTTVPPPTGTPVYILRDGTYNVSGADAIINTVNLTVRIKGQCSDLIINGSNTDVAVEGSLQRVLFNGGNNDVSYAGPSSGAPPRPAVVNNGPNNDVRWP